MKKRIAVAVLLALVAIGGRVLAADQVAECEVKAKEGKKVVLDCGKDATILEEGSPVKVVPEVKRRRIEGC